jgi:hypothetical protein
MGAHASQSLAIWWRVVLQAGLCVENVAVKTHQYEDRRT